MKKKSRYGQAKIRQKIVDRTYGESKSEAIRLWNDWLKSHELQITKAPDLAFISGIWNPPVPKYITEHVAGTLLSSRLTGKALLWRDAAGRGYLDWAAKHGIETPLTGLARDLDYSNWSNVPIGSVEETWRFFHDKIPMTRAEFNGLARKSHAAAFTIADTENKLLVNSIKGLADEAVKGNLTVYEFIKSAKEAWNILGVTKAKPYHLETVCLTNVHSAANAARWQELQRDSEGLREFFPYLEFITAADDLVCEICSPMAGRVYPRDDLVWQRNYPPLHHRCRCQVTEISVLEAEEEGIKPGNYPDAPQPAPGFDQPPAEMFNPQRYVWLLSQDFKKHLEASHARTAA